MWLLHTKILQLYEFHDHVPPHAILSHRWASDECTFQDMRSAQRPNSNGYRKILQCCARAASEGWSYVWIDTCCIDRTNSVELSEAITSMFDYYHDAGVCYAHLSDVDVAAGDLALPVALKDSSWFRRGWTLQELLAPRRVVLLNSSWDEIGTRNDLRHCISEITGIEPEHLRGRPLHAGLAERMSWMGDRSTTRAEDLAYCMMGIFGVRITLYYGEGAESAFLRLQYRILEQYDDDSLFAWNNMSGGLGVHYGLLATSPSLFKGCATMRLKYLDSTRRPFMPSSRGLRGFPLLVPVQSNTSNGCRRYLMLLNCVNTSLGTQWNTTSRVAVLLEETSRETFVRIQLVDPISQLFREPWDARTAIRRVVYVEQHRLTTHRPSSSASAIPSLKSVQWEVDALRDQKFSVDMPETDDGHAVCLVSRDASMGCVRDCFLIALEHLDRDAGITVRIHDPRSPSARTSEPRMGPPIGRDYRNTWRTFRTLSSGAWLTVCLVKQVNYHVVGYKVKITYCPAQSKVAHETSTALVPAARDPTASEPLALVTVGETRMVKYHQSRPVGRRKELPERRSKYSKGFRLAALIALSIVARRAVF